MIIKISRQDCLDKYTKLPLREYDKSKDDYDSYYPKKFSSYVLTLAAKSYKGHIKLLGTEIKRLTLNFGFDSLIFLGDVKIPWLYRDSDYKPAKEALQYLVDNKIGKRFEGALQVDTTQLPTFIKHLSWLVRCNTVLPYIHFTDKGQSLIGSICQYGNLHIDTLDKKADNILKTLVDKSKFEYLGDRNCYNKFSKTGAIKGRQISV
jgi:hypothetical protein